MKIKVDRQGRVVIPKDARRRYGLIEGTELEMITHEDKIELIPLVMKDDPAIIILKEPCKTGDLSKHDLAFSRERAWRR